MPGFWCRVGAQICLSRSCGSGFFAKKKNTPTASEGLRHPRAPNSNLRYWVCAVQPSKKLLISCVPGACSMLATFIEGQGETWSSGSCKLGLFLKTPVSSLTPPIVGPQPVCLWVVDVERPPVFSRTGDAYHGESPIFIFRFGRQERRRFNPLKLKSLKDSIFLKRHRLMQGGFVLWILHGRGRLFLLLRDWDICCSPLRPLRVYIACICTLSGTRMTLWILCLARWVRNCNF